MASVSSTRTATLPRVARCIPPCRADISFIFIQHLTSHRIQPRQRSTGRRPRRQRYRRRLQKYLADSGAAPEYILYNAIAALLDCPNTSLLGVNRLLTDSAYRRRITRHVRDPFVRAFWTEEYESYDARFQREAIAPIQNKLGQFLLNPVVRNILGQVRSKVSIPFMMNRERIFIGCNLRAAGRGQGRAPCRSSTQFQLAAWRA